MKLGLIGHPVEHSLSPLLFSLMKKECGLELSYELFSLSSEEKLRHFLSEETCKKLTGFNVTLPYKETVIPYLQELSAEARMVGAVNTVHLVEEKSIGHNTDVDGVLLSLEHLDLNGQTVLVYGAGGAARSVLAALVKKQAGRIYLINRTRERAEKLKNAFTPFLKKTELCLIQGDEIKNAPPVSLYVNATSQGLHEDSPFSLPLPQKVSANALAFDLISHREKTPFLQWAQGNNLRLMNGLAMLVGQAYAALRIWSEQDLSLDLKTIEEKLRHASFSHRR